MKTFIQSEVGSIHQAGAGKVFGNYQTFKKTPLIWLGMLISLLSLAPSGFAQIALVDNELAASPFSATSTALLLTTNLTVTPMANTLVVAISFRNGSASATEAPATLNWTNATTTNVLTLAIQKGSKAAAGGRCSAIYYCYNPTAGTGFNISGKLSGQVGTSGALVAYTLSGVDTMIAIPPTGSTSASPLAGAAIAPISFVVSGITPNSWAAVSGDVAATTTAAITITNGGAATGTPVLTTTGVGFSSATTALMGYVSAIVFGGSDTFAMTMGSASDSSLSAVIFSPSTLAFLAVDQQPQSVVIASGQNATFTVRAGGNPAVTTYQWYQVSGGATNLIASANTSSYTVTAATTSAGYFVVVGNGSATVSSSVASLNIFTSGVWNTSGGSWNAPANWAGNATASGIGALASFVNGLGGTVTLDNTPGFTVGTNIFGAAGATTVQPAWTINSGSPAGVLTMALDPSVPTSVVSGSAANTVTQMPVISIYPNNPVTINAPLAGNQGLFVNSGGSLVLAGGNTNNTYSGITVIGNNNTDTTELQVGNGGTSGAIDFVNNIFLSGYAHLIFNRSDTVTLSSIIRCQAGKAPNVIVNSGTVIMAPTANINPFMGAIVNSGGTMVLNCPAGVTAFANQNGTVNITNGTPNSALIGQNSGNIALGINSGGTVKLAGLGGNGVNIPANNGVLNNGVFDLGGDAVQIRFMAGAGIVTNSGATLSTLNLGGLALGAFPWNGTIGDGVAAPTAVTLSAGTTTFTSPNTYSGNTLLAGGALILTNSASLASANIILSSANLILANSATLTNPNLTLSVGSGRTLDLTGLTGGFNLNAGQTLVVTNTGKVNAGINPVIVASGSTLVPGGNGTAGTITINANLTLNGNTNLFDLATTPTEGVGNDEIVGITNLTLNGNITIQINTGFNNNFNPVTTYKLIKYSGTLANTATFTVTPATLGGNTTAIDTTSQPGYILLTTGGSSPPLLTILSTNVDAATGYPITLAPGVSGSTPMSFQWFNGATPIASATNANYTFIPTIPGVYTYTIYATNGYGNDNKTITVTVGSPAISVQCALDVATKPYALYLSPTDTAGAYGLSNWNVIVSAPSVTSGTISGITANNLLDAGGFATPVSFTAVGAQDCYQQALTITNSDTANARFMNTYWYANPAYTPASSAITFTFTNLPNDNYDVYVYLIQFPGGNASVYDGDGTTNYVQYPTGFSSSSNFVTAINTSATALRPLVNYVKLRISTGGSNSISFTESGAGVPGVQLVPVTAAAPTITQQPLSQRVVTNLTATFTVQANGFPLAYQWYTVSLAGVTNTIANATNNSYTTLPVLDSDTGTSFFVIVSNYLGQVQSSTVFLTAGHLVIGSGLLTDDQYNGLGGSVGMLNQIYPNSPSLAQTPPNKTEYLATFDSNKDLAGNSTERIYGWFVPAVSGDYVFFMTSDDAGALWLSTDNGPVNTYLIAQNQSNLTWRDWTCLDTNSGEYKQGYAPSGEFRSDLFIGGGGQNAFNQYTTGWAGIPNFNGGNGGITLVAGTKYYIELDHVQTAGGQNAAVTYKLAGNPDPASNSPSLFTGGNIASSIPDSILPATRPALAQITLAGSNVILTGTNGLLNAVYHILSTTNLATPLANWTVSPPNVFDASGNFISTNAATANATFYRLQTP